MIVVTITTVDRIHKLPIKKVKLNFLISLTKATGARTSIIIAATVQMSSSYPNYAEKLFQAAVMKAIMDNAKLN